METKFTGGTWVISGGNQIVSMPSQCKIANGVSGWTPEEADANGQLMVTAPEMYEALLNLTRAIKMRTSVGNDLIHELIQAEKALKKAAE